MTVAEPRQTSTDTRSSSGRAAPPNRRDLRRIILASLVGTSIEWYDFFIYGTAAALVFGPQFFPSSSSTAETLAAFSTFAVGFAARPIGAIVMGHFGDRVGRKSMLVFSLSTMGLATFLIGVLPTYAQIGAWAPALLVVFRCLQGFGVGGEWGGATLMAVEHAPRDRRGLYGAFAPMGTPAGVILANVVFLVLTAVVAPGAFNAWGWRIPFLLSAALVIVGLLVRLKIEETPVFHQLAAEQRERKPQAPIIEVLRTHPKEIALGALAFAANNGFGYILIAYVLHYGTDKLHVAKGTMLTAVLIAAAVWLVTCFVFAAWSDRLGRRKVYFWGAGIGLLWTFPFFWLINTANPILITLALVVLTIPLAATFSPLAAMFSELFPTRMRFTGNSVTYQIGAVLGGGFTPLIAVALVSATGTTLSISAYLFISTAIGLIAVLFMPETSRRSLVDLSEFPDGAAAEAL